MTESWLYWVGCAGSFDPRNQRVAKAFSALLHDADVPFAILGTDERCCGDPARRLGNEFLFQTLADANREAIAATEATHVVTTCPHCYRVLKHEYGVGAYEVVHHSQLLARLIAEGRLTPPPASDGGRTAYHDSCYLGRYEGIYQQPRDILSAVPGLVQVDLPRSGPRSFCCGGGGGRAFLEEQEGERVNHLRTDEIIAAGAQTLVTACPYCMTMLQDGSMDRDEAFEVLDLAEILSPG